MSKRDWDGTLAPWIIVAIGLAIVAFFAFTLAFSKGYQRANKDHESAYAAHYAAQRDYEECLSKASVEEAVKCTKEADKAYRENARADEDLNAQREMADWAEGMLWATAFIGVLTVGVTSLGVYWVRETLAETRRAVKAADDAVVVTREIGEKQLRAYVSIPTATVGGPDKPVVTIRFKNSGQTPAYDVRVWANSLFHRFPLIIDLPGPEREPRKSIAVLGPGDPYTVVVDAKHGFSQGERMAIQSGEAAIYVFGEILYRDAFNEKRFYRFRMFYGGDAGVNADGLLSAHEDGNEAN